MVVLNWAFFVLWPLEFPSSRTWPRRQNIINVSLLKTTTIFIEIYFQNYGFCTLFPFSFHQPLGSYTRSWFFANFWGFIQDQREKTFRFQMPDLIYHVYGNPQLITVTMFSLFTVFSVWKILSQNLTKKLSALLVNNY